jgi:proliferating cell nuclear antigen PCNA
MHIEIHEKTKVEEFCCIFRDIKTFIEDVNIMFNSEKMYIQSMDSTHVMLLEVVLPNTWFDVYNVSEPITIGLKACFLQKIIKTRDKNQKIVWKMNMENDDDECLHIHFYSDDKTEFDKNFELPLIDIDSELLQIPDDNDDSGEIILSSEKFANLVSQLKDVGDILKFNVSEDCIIMSSESSEKMKMQVKIEIDDITEFSIEENISICSSFSLRYIKDISAFYKISKFISLKITENKPMKFIYNLSGNMNEDTNNAYIIFYLAPQIDDD